MAKQKPSRPVKSSADKKRVSKGRASAKESGASSPGGRAKGREASSTGKGRASLRKTPPNAGSAGSSGMLRAEHTTGIGKATPVPDPSGPKTTRPDAESRRTPDAATKVDKKLNRKLDAVPDRIDIRDWFYQPSLAPLPAQIINCHNVPAILDQGTEGACTGFALSAVINYLLDQQSIRERVSPYMLYHLARRYDEWPGEEYEGSSARGAMKGWVRHGVCREASLGRDDRFEECFTDKLRLESLLFPGGAFYRVMHRQVRDMHAALNETGILYCTLMVHAGWGLRDANMERLNVSCSNWKGKEYKYSLPIIKRQGPADGGHAVAIVGYTREGFIIQNSWGEQWGDRGFALLPYEDYLIHATDVWVAQTGVPVASDLWVENGWTDTTAGVARVEQAIQLNTIRPYIIDVGNNGRLSASGDYWTTDKDIETLLSKTIPEATASWSKKRLLLYLHGGLNSERSVAQRVMAFRDVMLANEIYPIHIMWETGVMESLRGIMEDFITDDDRAGGVGDWLKKVRNGLIEAKDRTFELSVAGAGTRLWDEMKENARLASHRPDGLGAMQIVQREAEKVLSLLKPAERKEWELHVVAHSAGSIFTGYALDTLCEFGFSFKSLQLLAPAITLDEFRKLYMARIQDQSCPRPTLYILSDTGELDDDVGPYGKSLLYLVSNAFERVRETPLLGMERFILDEKWEGRNDYADVRSLWKKGGKHTGSLIIAGEGKELPDLSRSDSHGGFDNDKDTLNSVLWRILGRRAAREFENRDLQY